jgi:hypothetical protein
MIKKPVPKTTHSKGVKPHPELKSSPHSDKASRSSSKKGKIYPITQEKIKDPDFGIKNTKIELEDFGKRGLFIVARDNKGRFLTYSKYQKGKAKKKQIESVRSKIKPVKEINLPKEPKDTTKKTKKKNVTYNSYYRYGLIIYEMKAGKRYNVFCQVNGTGAPDDYVSFDEVLALLNEEVVAKTGIPLNNWLTDLRRSENLYIDGGMRLKRYKVSLDLKTRDMKRSLDYDKEIDFNKL